MLTEKLPRPGCRWTKERTPSVLLGMNAQKISVWRKDKISVISTLVHASYPDGQGAGLQWHLSLTHQGRRPRKAEILEVLHSFDMVEAEEDNHHPGNARHFWIPVDPAHRVACQCKETEDTLVDNGYSWTNPKEGHGECRGCQFERMTGKKCPVHHPE